MVPLPAHPRRTGPAAIIGHVDSARWGPAVFYRLGALHPGNRISITRADGRTAVFAVQTVRSAAKAGFPSQAVYGAVPYPALRLITCGGDFDTTSGHSRAT